MKFTPERIYTLNKNEVFVFGSNLHGMHYGGAALVAFEEFGAKWGQGVGLQGQSYAIPTMQGGVETIRPYVNEFVEFAKSRRDLTFYVTRIGCGIAGFKDEEIAILFAGALLVENIILPKEFWFALNSHNMRKCGNCQKIIENRSAKFCRYCGAILPDLDVAQSRNDSTVDVLENVESCVQLQTLTDSLDCSVSTPPPMPSSYVKKNRRIWLFAVVVGVIMLLFVIAGVILMKSHYNDDHVESVSESVIPNKMNLYGNIYKYPITMSISVDENRVRGSYYYDKLGPTNILLLSGSHQNGELIIYETDNHGKQTGYFRGHYLDGVYRGLWFNDKGESLGFILQNK